MSKLSELQQFENLTVDELFVIKGGCGSKGPNCETKACTTHACDSSSCSSGTCMSLACGSTACDSCQCDSGAEAEPLPPQD